MNGFPDKCSCGFPADVAALVEDDENPLRGVTKYLCYNCLEKEGGVIDAWTWAEWVNE